MARIVELKTNVDPRGSLTVIEKELPFPIKRLFFIYDVTAARGGHRHKRTRMAMIALGGKACVFCQTPEEDQTFLLSSPNQCLILEPEDWHRMDEFEEHTSLVVLASEGYDKDDYIYEKYR